MSEHNRWRRAQRDRNIAFGVAIVAGFLLLLSMPPGDSYTPHWIVSTVLTIALVVSAWIAWLCTDEIKQIEKGK